MGVGVKNSKSAELSFSTNLTSLSPFMIVSGLLEGPILHHPGWRWGSKNLKSSEVSFWTNLMSLSLFMMVLGPPEDYNFLGCGGGQKLKVG